MQHIDSSFALQDSNGTLEDHIKWPKEDIKNFIKQILGSFRPKGYLSPCGITSIGWGTYSRDKLEITE